MYFVKLYFVCYITALDIQGTPAQTSNLRLVASLLAVNSSAVTNISLL